MGSYVGGSAPERNPRREDDGRHRQLGPHLLTKPIRSRATDCNLAARIETMISAIREYIASTTPGKDQLT